MNVLRRYQSGEIQEFVVEVNEREYMIIIWPEYYGHDLPLTIVKHNGFVVHTEECVVAEKDLETFLTLALL